MSITKFDEYKDFSQLFIESDKESNNFQKKFIFWRKFQLISLIFSTLVAVFTYSWVPFLFIFSIFIATISVVLIWWMKYDQKWYLWRSVAESVKSASWQYMMRGEKFRPDLSIQSASIEFENFSTKLIGDLQKESPSINLAELSCFDKMPTDNMISIRELDFQKRSELYIEQRIKPQRNWYASKSKKSTSLNNLFSSATFISFIISGVFVILDFIEIPFAKDYGTAFGSLFVAVGLSFITWTQIRNYSNLAISYNYTAVEIDQLRSEFEVEINKPGFNDKRLSELIQNSEAAFSREHTSWRARQQQI